MTLGVSGGDPLRMINGPWSIIDPRCRWVLATNHSLTLGEGSVSFCHPLGMLDLVGLVEGSVPVFPLDRLQTLYNQAVPRSPMP